MLNAHLRGVSKKWYSLGLYLGFTTDQLKDIVSTVDVNCDPAIYLSKVLSAWLHSANPPIMEILCRALSHERMGEQMLALQLLKRECIVIVCIWQLGLLNSTLEFYSCNEQPLLTHAWWNMFRYELVLFKKYDLLI